MNQRIRTIKPDFFADEDLYEAEAQTALPLRVAYIGLWTVADREGRFKWKVRELKRACLPYDNIDFSRVLDALTTRKFVVRYEVNGQVFGWIPTFTKHQVINNKERPSELPKPSENNTLTRTSRDSNATATRDPRVTQGKEGNSKKDTLPDGNDADASDDLKSRIFGPAREWLGRQTGKTDRTIRTLLGKWCSRYGDGPTLEALQQASRNAPLDPIPYIVKILEKPRDKRSFEDQQRADRAAIFAVIAPELGAMDGADGDIREPDDDDSKPEAMAGAGRPPDLRGAACETDGIRQGFQCGDSEPGQGGQDLSGDPGDIAGGSVGPCDIEDEGDLEVGQPPPPAGGHKGNGSGGLRQTTAGNVETAGDDGQGQVKPSNPNIGGADRRPFDPVRDLPEFLRKTA